MRRKLLSALLSIGLMVSLAPAAFALPTANAIPTNDTLRVNGQIRNATVYKIGSSNYFKIRDVAAVLNGTGSQFSVGYDAAAKSVTATTGESYETTGSELAGAASASRTATISNDKIIVNGAAAENVTVYKIGGSNYFKLRDLGKVLGFEVDYVAGQGMLITTADYEHTTPNNPDIAEDGHIHNWETTHVEATGYYTYTGTHKVQYHKCDCGFTVNTDQSDAYDAWKAHRRNCSMYYMYWDENVPNGDREWVEVAPAYDYTYCTECGIGK